ncbi:hypothetical protein SESBI_28439 [Sesbania bispinosa]|nr:hypothetical protein SESBI_28439 [Sesbania bispinosa]
MSDDGAIVRQGETIPEKGRRRGLLERVIDWLGNKDKGEWLKDMKRSPSLTAIVMATMAFQLALTHQVASCRQVSIKLSLVLQNSRDHASRKLS